MFSNHHLRYAPMYGAPLHRHQPTFDSLDDFDDLLIEDARHSEQAREVALLEALRLEEHGRHSHVDSYFGSRFAEPEFPLFAPPAVRQLGNHRREAEARLRAAIIAREREQALLLEQERIRKAEEHARLMRARRAAEQRRLLFERARAAEQQRIAVERARAAEERRLVEEAERQLRARLQYRERLVRAHEQARLSQWRLNKDRDSSRAQAERVEHMIAAMKAHLKPNAVTRYNAHPPVEGFRTKRVCPYHAAPASEKAVRFALPSPPSFASHPPAYDASNVRAPAQSVPAAPSKPSPAPQDSLESFLQLLFGEDVLKELPTRPQPSAPKQPEVPSEELEKQFEAFLKLFTGDASLVGHSGPSAPVAGPSGLKTDEKDRIPFEQKGKWRAPGSTEETESVEAQIAADAALAARLQAEENAKARNNRPSSGFAFPSPGGIVINEPVGSSPSPKAPSVVINDSKPSTSKPASPVSSSHKEPVAAPAPAPEPSVEETKSAAMHTLDTISNRFSTLTENFTFPTTLDTRPASPTPSVSSVSTLSTLGLPHTPANAPVHAHTHALEKLLGELDAVESNGNDEVRMKRKELVGQVERAIEGVERSVAAASPAPVEEKVETDFEEVKPVADSTEPAPTSDLSLSTLAHAAFGAEPAKEDPVVVSVPVAEVASLETLAHAAFGAEPVPDEAEVVEEEPVVVDTTPVSPEPVVVEVAVPKVADAATPEPSVSAEEPTTVEEPIVAETPEATQVVDDAPSAIEEQPAPAEAASEPASVPVEESNTPVDVSLASSEVTVKAPTSPVQDLSLSFPAAEGLASSGILATPAGVDTADADEVDTFLLPASRPVSPRRVPVHADFNSEDEALLVDGLSSGEEWSDLEPEEK